MEGAGWMEQSGVHATSNGSWPLKQSVSATIRKVIENAVLKDEVRLIKRIKGRNFLYS